jgi:hypothetical protein
VSVALPDEPRDLPTIDGPEAEGIIKELKGQLVYPEPVGGLLVTLLPSLEKKTVRPAGKHPAVSDLSGSDRDGRIAVVESSPGKEVVLRLVGTSGSEGKEILRRPDAGFRSKAIGRPALCPVGALVAFVSKTQSLTMKVEPKITFREGVLEVWQAEERRPLKIEAKAIDRSLTWLSDGKSLLYSVLVGPDTVPAELIEDYSRASGSGLIPVVEKKAPVVHRMELPGGNSAPLCVGRRSVVSTDGKVMLVEGIGFEWLVYDTSSRQLAPAKLPGLYDTDRVGIYEGGVIAFLGNDLAIYWGLPTKGAVQRTTKNNSPLVGAKKMPSIKAARLSTGEFQTIIPFMDPRNEVRFGEVVVPSK